MLNCVIDGLHRSLAQSRKSALAWRQPYLCNVIVGIGIQSFSSRNSGDVDLSAWGNFEKETKSMGAVPDLVSNVVRSCSMYKTSRILDSWVG